MKPYRMLRPSRRVGVTMIVAMVVSIELHAAAGHHNGTA